MFATVFLCVLSAATSFLIDASTPNPPKAGTIKTDDHYNALLNLLMQETQSRQNLETYVNQLNQKMTEMANDVASTKTKVGVLEKTNYYADLQEASRCEIMKQAYNSLLLEHSNLKREVNVVTQRNNQLQLEVDYLKQLKTILPLQSLANVNNFTVHLEKEIQNTNSIVNKVLSDENARKQDCIVLMNVTNVLKTRLSDTQLFIDQKFKDMEIKQSLTLASDHEFESKMDKINQTVTAKANGLENRINADLQQLTVKSQNISNVLKTKLSETKLLFEKKFKDIEIKYNSTLTDNVIGLENRISIQNITATTQTIMAKLTRTTVEVNIH